jgi:3-dehydroquinate dehydratase I
LPIYHFPQVIDELIFITHEEVMSVAQFSLQDRRCKVVGSLGSLLDLHNATDSSIRESCDIAEIRLDLLFSAHRPISSADWSHLKESPLLFTARRKEEGGAHSLNIAQRIDLLEKASEQAAWIDVEVASIDEMTPFLDNLKERKIPWLASFHDFEHLPPTRELEWAAKRALDAGANLFKAAVKLESTSDLARLADFQLADHGIPVATMGMGALATVSRLLCAQCGSRFNYGYLGEVSTAPGQWDSALLKTAISRLSEFHG